MSAYAHCACRDCFATVVMQDHHELCDDCSESGCKPYDGRSLYRDTYKYDCQAPGAYGTEPGGMDSDR